MKSMRRTRRPASLMRFVGARLMPWRCTALEHLNDDHAAAAGRAARLVGIDSGSGGLALGSCSGEQLTSAGNVVGARNDDVSAAPTTVAAHTKVVCLELNQARIIDASRGF